MTYDDFVRMALELPETEDALYYGSPAVKRAARAMLSGGQGADVIAMKLDWNTLDEVVDEHPDVFYQTDHQSTWPWVSVRLSLLEPELAKTVLQASWQDAPKPGKRRKIAG